MKPFKTGIAHLAEAYPHVPVVPLCIHGAGKALPRGEALFVPFIIDVNIGEEVFHEGREKREYTEYLQGCVEKLERVMVNG